MSVELVQRPPSNHSTELDNYSDHAAMVSHWTSTILVRHLYLLESDAYSRQALVFFHLTFARVLTLMCSKL